MFAEVLAASALHRACDEDLCSQFNHLWTSFILAAMGLGISALQYIGNPILCWCPAQMPQVQCNYTIALCWVKENYYKHESEDIEVVEDERYNVTTTFYPWVPWLLFFMSGMLNIPHFLWMAFSRASGINLCKMIDLAEAHENTENLATILRIWLVRTPRGQPKLLSRLKRFLGMMGFFWFGIHQRTYLCGLTIFVKLSYLMMSIALYLFINYFIGEDYISFGYDVVLNFMNGIPTRAEGFPIQTICDIRIRQMNNIHTYSIQCVLPINLYNEKIFIFLWFWMQIVIAVNAYSLFKWTYYLLSYERRWSFVKEYVIIHFHLLHRDNSELVDENANHREEEELIPNMFRPLRPLSRDGGTRPLRRIIRDVLLIDHRREKKYGLISSIETNELEMRDLEKMREINRITKQMLKHIGHDGVVVFRTLQDAVGIVTANQIFQNLYEQLNATYHYS